MDLSKAFDSLNHQLLLNKLQYIGLKGIPFQWFQSYMYNRSQVVYCNSQFSRSRIISNGVPQGSILGPLLFLVYIDDTSKPVILLRGATPGNHWGSYFAYFEILICCLLV